MKDKEVFRTGRLTASISLDGTNFESIGSFDLTATSSTYSTHTFSLNTTPLGNISGKMGYIRFELTHPGGGLQIGVDRVYIDNVRLLGVGLPLQAESGSGLTNDASTQITQMEISLLIGAAQSQWQGLIQTPNGIAGVTLGQVGVTTPDLSFQNVADIDMESSEQNRNAGSSEGGFNDQFFFTNTNVLIGSASLDQQPTTDEIAFNGYAPFTSNSHAIQAQPDTGLTDGVVTTSELVTLTVGEVNIAPVLNAIGPRA